MWDNAPSNVFALSWFGVQWSEVAPIIVVVEWNSGSVIEGSQQKHCVVANERPTAANKSWPYIEVQCARTYAV